MTTGTPLSAAKGESLLLVPKPDIDLANLQCYLRHHRACQVCGFET